MKINCYFCDYDNFGDQLNRIIFKKEIGYYTGWSIYERSTIIGIGSIIEAIIVKPEDKRKCNKEIVYCFSSGFAREEQITELVKTNFDISLLRPVKFLAIRGVKTKELLIKTGLMDKSVNPVLADGGLLVSDLLKQSIKKKYEVGIVAHAQEKKNPIFQKLLTVIPHSTLIDIQQDPIIFLNHLAECDTIISTAMHPLIASDSLRIPNMWVRLTEKKSATQKFKFDDYYSAFGLVKESYDIYKVDNNIKQKIIDEYNISDTIISQKKEELRKCLFILKEHLNTNINIQRKKYYANLLYMIFKFYPYKVCIGYPKRVINKMSRMLHE